MASAVVASACAETAEEPIQTKVASAPAGAVGQSMQTTAIDTVREWDPAKADAYLKVNTNPWTNGVLDIKTIELICVGLNAACTNLQPEPTRRHIRAALQAGATGRDRAGCGPVARAARSSVSKRGDTNARMPSLHSHQLIELSQRTGALTLWHLVC